MNKSPSKALVVVKPKALATVIAPEVPLHNLYHRNGMLSTAMASCWFVLTGMELKRRKKEAGHGNWEKWVADNCEYSDDTAGKYMKVAERVKDKALKASAQGGGSNPDLDRFLELLEKPASALSDAQQITLLKSVHGLTDGATISELYEDFGIVKKAKRKGGKTYERSGGKGARKALSLDDATQAALDIWTPLMTDLQREGLKEASFTGLPETGVVSIETLRGLLTDLAKKVGGKGGK